MVDWFAAAMLGRDAQIAQLHYQIHLTKKGCCCPGRDVACPGCPQHAADHAPCPTCGHAIESAAAVVAQEAE